MKGEPLSSLRARAEESLRERGSSLSGHELAELGTLIHELDVYGAELELQNESLRQTQSALAASNERYLELFRHAPVGYFVLDQEGIVVEANPAALGQLGREAVEIVGRPLLPLLARESHPALTRLLATANRREERATAELKVAAAGEAGPDLLAEAITLTREADQRAMVLCATVDVSGRKRAEQALSRSEERYRSLFESSRDAIVLLTRAGTILEGNPAASRLFGHPAQALQSHWLADLVAPEDLARVTQLVAGDGAGTPAECTFLRADGSRVPVELSVVRAHGNLVQLSARDTSERVRAAEERARLEQQVQRAQRLDALGKLAGGIAHDMNNIFAAVLTIGSSLGDALGEGSPRDDLDAILTAARRGGELTQGLLAFARGDSTVHQPAELGALCRDVLAIVTRTAPARVKVKASLGDEPLPIDGDASAISHALINLCTNAVDAMPEGGELHVEAGRVAGTHRVRVSVRDTGHGMDELTAAHAFEPFFTTKARGKGTGLGLSTAYGTARAHGGSIVIDSAPGRGTTVTIELPSSPGRVRAAAAGPSAPPASACPRVLVVDDEPMVLRGVARLLQRLGLDPIALNDPQQALELLTSGPPFALHVFDVNMPHVDGLALARRLHERDPEARVLFMSGYNAERLDDDLASRATVRFVNKPFEMAALSEAVKALLPS
jgi:hypothetical protein